MATTTAQTLDVSAVLMSMLNDVTGVRAYSYVSDATRPPAAVIGLPLIDWQDAASGFCWARWEFPITIITTRSNDRDAQQELSRLVRDVAIALSGSTPEGVFDITLMDASPTTAAISGQELPAYLVRVQVRA